MAAPITKLHVHGLDIIRIVAALLVVSHHFALIPISGSDGSMAFPWLGFMAGVGAVGVEIFFVISGFVIAMSTATAAATDFLRHRILRILPALWICGLIALAARAIAGEDAALLLESYLRSALLFPKGPYIDGVVWTLVVEAVFYALIFATMLIWARPPLEKIAKALGLASAGFLAIFAVSAVLRDHADLPGLYHVLERFHFKVLLLRHGVFFALGILLYLHLIRRSRVVSPGFLAMLIVSGIVEIAITLDAEGGSIAMALALWLAGLAGIVGCVHFRDGIARRLSPRYRHVIRKLGLLSYPLYLNHYAFGLVLVPGLFTLGLGDTSAFVLSAAIIVSTSWFIMDGPEKALRDLLDEQFERCTAAVVNALRLVRLGRDTR